MGNGTPFWLQLQNPLRPDQLNFREHRFYWPSFHGKQIDAVEKLIITAVGKVLNYFCASEVL